ncbi:MULTISPECIES: PTS galactitol transporter subunit IIC [Heyndrickxia]|jgi:PTS system galactitol-specific IIC component|uniref:PTS galactitol transporter subunit IIC n=1 Tax=Heyndrickxia TaxID=2837504 RepID=UPI0021B49BCA|nr:MULTISPECIES: PTS transporter subunit IIC [Heyndrickxia]MED4893249.1 PTS transporter subunit IIC [Weizmannia sp. CD-2023]MED4975698.1 PTS transporter subunit IIC [Weizmannia sp. CD-2023]UXC22938.1 PTS galactitol transporter subunit IIC [Heyndrickxia coagulans]
MEVIQWFVGLGASVMLPILLFIFALILGIKPGRAFKAGLTVGIGFVGLNLVINLLTSNLGPAAQAMVKNYDLHLSSIDVGWPAASAIAYGTVLGSMAIPVSIIVNIILLFIGITKTLDVDIWNYWHVAFTGSLVYAATSNFWLGIYTMVVHAMLIYLLADMGAKTVQKYYNLPNITFPHGASAPGLLVAIPLNWLFDRIPGINKIHLDPETVQKRLGIFGDSTVMGTIIGIVIGLLAKYSIAKTLQLGINTAAVMMLMPRMVSLLMEGLTPISEGANEFVQKKFPGRNLYIGMDSALAVGQSSVLSSSLILVPLTLLIAVFLPGNKVLPFGDLATIPFMIALMAAVFRGDIFRTVIGGAINIALSLYIATWAAPMITKSAIAANFNLNGSHSISVLSDGGVWTTWMIVGLGKLLSWGGITIIGVIVLAGLVYFNKIRKDVDADNG